MVVDRQSGDVDRRSGRSRPCARRTTVTGLPSTPARNADGAAARQVARHGGLTATFVMRASDRCDQKSALICCLEPVSCVCVPCVLRQHRAVRSDEPGDRNGERRVVGLEQVVVAESDEHRVVHLVLRRRTSGAPPACRRWKCRARSSRLSLYFSASSTKPGNLVLARAAPGRPEIDEQGPALEVGQAARPCPFMSLSVKSRLAFAATVRVAERRRCRPRDSARPHGDRSGDAARPARSAAAVRVQTRIAAPRLHITTARVTADAIRRAAVSSDRPRRARTGARVCGAAARARTLLASDSSTAARPAVARAAAGRRTTGCKIPETVPLALVVLSVEVILCGCAARASLPCSLVPLTFAASGSCPAPVVGPDAVRPVLRQEPRPLRQVRLAHLQDGPLRDLLLPGARAASRARRLLRRERLPAHQRRAEARPGRACAAHPLQDGERVPGATTSRGETAGRRAGVRRARAQPDGAADRRAARPALPAHHARADAHLRVRHHSARPRRRRPAALGGRGTGRLHGRRLEPARPDAGARRGAHRQRAEDEPARDRSRCRAACPTRSVTRRSSSSNRAGARKACASSCSRCARASSAAARARTKRRSSSSPRTSTSSSIGT